MIENGSICRKKNVSRLQHQAYPRIGNREALFLEKDEQGDDACRSVKRRRPDVLRLFTPKSGTPSPCIWHGWEMAGSDNDRRIRRFNRESRLPALFPKNRSNTGARRESAPVFFVTKRITKQRLP